MRASQFSKQLCSVARTLEIVGEQWTLLIVREAFFGTRRFSHFEANLGIAKNVLSDRLAKLVAAGVLRRVACEGRGNPGDYLLTERGRDLFPVLIALMQWGDRWVYGATRAPVRVVDRARSRDVAPVQVVSAGGDPLSIRDVFAIPGPGADETVQRRLGAEGTTS